MAASVLLEPGNLFALYRRSTYLLGLHVQRLGYYNTPTYPYAPSYSSYVIGTASSHIKTHAAKEMHFHQFYVGIDPPDYGAISAIL